ncbi:MAG: 4Fe-4S binding protein [Victivallaceae bacterium]
MKSHPLKIAVASGKGGTGKTTVALALAESSGTGALLLDCDVEEPNCHLFVAAAPASVETVTILKPQVVDNRCTGCGRCRQICRFNALAVLGKQALVFAELCHGCGGCAAVCPAGALIDRPHEIGEVRTWRGASFELIDGCLAIGGTVTPPLIRAVQAHSAEGALNTVVIDCPPGTSCSMVASVREADFVVLVTEPTPFGLHDLTLAVATLRELNLPMGVIINRADCGDDGVAGYCRREKLPILLAIPNRREIAECYSRGLPLLAAAPEYRAEFAAVINQIRTLLPETCQS